MDWQSEHGDGVCVCVCSRWSGQVPELELRVLVLFANDDCDQMWIAERVRRCGMLLTL